ncbi:MAG: ribosome maturation factor RimM [Clostridiales Family XIII bacterium]|jgi:16S rRNA processing protein RimM|nr:ribosome maturation factor RimM [Clostridiales Family XIII bacterium]
MGKILTGKIVNVVGLKGELKVYHYSDRANRFSGLDSVYVGDELCEIEGVRYVKNLSIIKLKGIDSVNEAEKRRGREVFILEEDLPGLPEDAYYVRDLIGAAVVDGGGGVLGEIRDVIQNRAQDIYEIGRPDGGAFLLPAVGAFIKNVDLENRRVTVELPEGLLDL